MGTFKFGLTYWKKYIPLSLLSKLFSLIAILCDTVIPLLTAGVIDFCISYDPADPPSGGFSPLFERMGEPRSWELFGKIAALFAALVLLRVVVLYLKNITFQWCGLRMECDLRAKTYAKLLGLDSETISRYNIGELLTTMNRDTIVFKEMYSRTLLNLYDSCLLISLSVATLALFDWRLLFVPLVIAVPFAISLAVYLKRARKLFRAIRESYSALDLAVQENISAVRIVRSFAAEETELEKFDACNRRIYERNVEEVKLSSKFNAIFTAFQQAGYVGTVVIAVLLVLSGHIEVGALTAATTYVTKIISHVTQISRSCFTMQNQLVSGGRLKRFLSEESAVPDLPSSHTFSPRPHIRMEGVFLTLGEKEVLKSIDLDIPYGKKVGIMGGTGSGKSALLKSLVRVFDVTSGKITLDGEDVRAYSLEDLRGEYAFVFQDVFLFSDTLDANIAFARPDCTDEEVRAAAEAAQAARFIDGLEEGYGTIVGERGMGLSGGQKQRVAIARALVKGSPVLVLDDATSALDMATERRVLEAVKALNPQATLLIATHRASAVADCDEILFLRDGEIVERGTADELLARDGAFASVWKLQAGDGALDDSSYGRAEL